MQAGSLRMLYIYSPPTSSPSAGSRRSMISNPPHLSFLSSPPSQMSKVGGKSGGKGGAKKTKSKGNGEDVKTTTRKLTTSQEILFKLRGVLFEATGKDRTDFGIPDVLMCKKFGETKISLTLSGAVPRDDKIPIFAMIKNSMEEQYEDSGFGWDDADKKKELGEKGGRFLIARDEAGKVLGFVSFRFTRAGEAVYQPIGPACVHMLDFVVSQRFRKNGLGKYMMAITMMIAKKADLPCVTIPVFSEEWKSFLDKTVKGEVRMCMNESSSGGDVVVVGKRRRHSSSIPLSTNAFIH